jgi:hypothetical protein
MGFAEITVQFCVALLLVGWLNLGIGAFRVSATAGPEAETRISSRVREFIMASGVSGVGQL